MFQIFITNNIRIRGASTPLRGAITKALTFENPAYQKAKRMRKRAWGIEKEIQLYLYDRGDIVTPRGFQTNLEEILRTQGYDPQKVTTVQQTDGNHVTFGWNRGWNLREYQKPFVTAVRKENGVGIAPAGSGKTIMALRYVCDKGRAAVWLTHTTDLMYQTAEKARKLLPDVGNIGFFGDGKHEWGDGKLIIATVQTLQRNQHYIDAMNDFVGTVVIDEAHHFPAVQFVEAAGRFKAANVLGVTATPDRKDGLDFYMYMGIGPVLHKVERGDLYDNGELIKPAVEFVYTDFVYEYASDRADNDSVDAGGDELDYTELKRRLISDEKRAKQIAENILENATKGPAIVITESVRYCFVLRDIVEKMAEARNFQGLNTAVVHGGISRYKWLTAEPEGGYIEKKKAAKGWKYKVEAYTPEEFEAWQVSAAKRKAIMEAANAGEIQILFATQLAREGLDMPHLTVGHMAMPKRGDGRGSDNGAAIEQEIGRIMRSDPANPDKKAYWYDYVDYEIGVLKDQYYSRRKVYKRLGIALPKKKKTEKDKIEDFLGSTAMFDLPF